MKNNNFKALVVAAFPGLTVKKDIESPRLFVMLNKNGEIFSEKMTSYSAIKSWEIAYKLMINGELQPYWKDDSEKSLMKSKEKLVEAKKDPNWQQLSEKQVQQFIDETLKEYRYT